MLLIRNAVGEKIDFKAAVSLMDDELREEVHGKFAPCHPHEFMKEYAELHMEKFGKPFAPWEGLAW